MARALALRRHHQPQLGAVEQQSQLHLGFPQQPLEALLGGGPPALVATALAAVQLHQLTRR